MKTNKKEIKESIQSHILNILETEEPDFSNDKEKIQYLVDRFNSEYVFPANIKRYGTYQKVFLEWLKGLAIGIYYTHVDINAYMESIGLPQPENKNNSDSWELYLNLIHRETKALCRKYNIEFIQ